MLFRERHTEDHCAMYDICGKRTDGKVLNCPFGSPAMKVWYNRLFPSQCLLGWITITTATDITIVFLLSNVCICLTLLYNIFGLV